MLHSLCCFPIRGEKMQSVLGALLLSFQVHNFLFYLSTSPVEWTAVHPRGTGALIDVRGLASMFAWHCMF